MAPFWIIEYVFFLIHKWCQLPCKYHGPIPESDLSVTRNAQAIFHIRAKRIARRIVTAIAWIGKERRETDSLANLFDPCPKIAVCHDPANCMKGRPFSKDSR